jgi:hypothetical protein
VPVVLVRARASWASADFDVAEPLYHAAIEAGGLTRDEVIEAYVHEGAAFAILGAPVPSLDAFKIAAILLPDFTLPPEAGKRASMLVEQLRRDKPQPLTIHLGAPDAVSSGAGFSVEVTTECAEPKLVCQGHARATDPMTHKSAAFTADDPAHAMFEIPSSLTLPGATLVVQSEAFDAHGNHLVLVEQKVIVTESASRNRHAQRRR